MTFPQKPTHIPLYYNVTSSGRPANGYYGELSQGTYDDGDYAPLYPFGYGLSYTVFEYGKAECADGEVSLEELKSGKKVTFSVEVTNNGSYDGKETVQLYISDTVASVIRPIRELKDYKKVFIKKGETKKVEFHLGFGDLGFYSENGDYLVEKGKFNIYIGKDCLTDNSAVLYVI